MKGWSGLVMSSSGRKHGRAGETCHVTHVYVSRTFMCTFEDDVEMKLPWEAVEKQTDLEREVEDEEEEDEEVVDDEETIEESHEDYDNDDDDEEGTDSKSGD